MKVKSHFFESWSFWVLLEAIVKRVKTGLDNKLTDSDYKTEKIP